MDLNSIIFIDSLPKIDLHGYDRESARVAINDFIKDSLTQNHEFVTIIHGIGSGVLRSATSNALHNNKNVIDYKTFYYNQGATVVQLKVKKKDLTNDNNMI